MNCLAKLSGVSCDVSVSENVLHYTNIKLGGQETDSLTFTIKPKSIGLVIDRDVRNYDAFDSSPFRMLFDVTVTPASPLGRARRREANNVYIADTYNNQVLKETLSRAATPRAR